MYDGISEIPDLGIEEQLRIKEVEIAMSIGELMTSRSIVKQTNFPDYDVHDAMIASALKKASQHADTFPKESKCRKAACSKNRPILARETKLRA